VAHRELTADQVGLSALSESAVRSVVLGDTIQRYIGKYAVFADVVNQEILRDLGGYTERYNVYAHEPLKFTESGLSEVDAFLLRAARATATVRVGTRLMNYVGSRLSSPENPDLLSRERAEVYFTVTPEEISKTIQDLRGRKGRLSADEKREVARSIVALAADVAVVDESSRLASTMLQEGENLRMMLESKAFQESLKSRDSGRFNLLPEIKSNLLGSLAGLKRAAIDGEAIVRNSRLWQATLADTLD
jgi:hypothetical protein